MKKLRALWQSFSDEDRRIRLGRFLGLIFILGGFAVIGKAWDGAANLVRVDSQFPYLLSGGFMGLGLIVTGAALLLLTTVRAERRVMADKLDDISTLLARSLGRMQISSNGAAAGEQVIAGSDAYHRPDCKVLEGKSGLGVVTVQQAAAEGLAPCRACDPPRAEPEETEKVSSEA